VPTSTKPQAEKLYYYYYLTPVLNSQGMKKLHYAIQKVQKSSWNEPYYYSIPAMLE